jgi:hypothetical protein
MTDREPEHIDVEAHKSLVKSLDFMVAGGSIYEVVQDDFRGELYLKRVDEIPQEYKDRWNDG